MMIVPRHVLGGNGFLAPSDQLTKAIIGVGGMGRGHIPYEGTKVVAICDVDKLHLDKAQSLIDYKVKHFSDFREVCQLPEVDIVHIAMLTSSAAYKEVAKTASTSQREHRQPEPDRPRRAR